MPGRLRSTGTRRADEGNNAQVLLPVNYHNAVINVTPGFADWPPRMANRVMLHELMHVLIRDLDHVATSAARQLGSQAHDVSQAAWKHAEEGFVEQMAQRLVDTWGLA